MKKNVLLLAMAVLALGGATSVATAQLAADATVQITSTGFNPDTTAINVGESVTWTNSDTSDHQVVLESPAVDSPVLSPGQSFSRRFLTAQTVPYHDGKKPSATGIVQVRGSATGVTLAATPRQVVFSSSVRITGGIGLSRVGQPVTIHIQPYSRAESTKTVMTDSDGIFEFTYQPKIRTEFSAEWSGGRSEQEPQVNVRPKVVFNVISAKRNYYSVRVSALRSYAGKVVRIQRLSSKGAWVTTKRVRLNARGRALFYGTFVRGRTHARAWINSTPGYVEGFSITKIITR